ncbi:MAG TPA: glutamate--tRNA ligase [Candidatus Limnocylindria bacterium]
MTVRVRFAPSPTGSLHIGSVRTALYNYFFARQNGGKLILRIEDTDQDRLVPGAIEAIYDGFDWVGVRWDEGPREGGPHAPYIQSERLPLYQKHAAQLVADGAGYYCFCSEERLASMRAQQERRKEITRYDRLCRRIDPKEAAERAATEPHVIRMKVPDDGSVAIDDLVYGRIEWPLNTIEDQVLLKSDGFPTYHLAVVVDDHVMGITHIFRGEDWLPSTPKHVLIFRAFGWDLPPLAHFPNVLGPDGKKLAKRHGATKVDEFRKDGYLPAAMVNYLALIGWAPGTEEEIFGVEELIARWRIDQVHRAGGKWDRARLDWFNGMYIRKLSEDELMKELDAFLPAEWDRDVIRKALPLLRERLRTLAEARDQVEFLFAEPPPYEATLLVPKKKEPREALDLLVQSTVVLGHIEPFDHAGIRSAIEGIAAALGWSLRDASHPVRVAVTGRTVGLPLFESLELLGRERTLARIERAQDLLEKGVD